MSYPLSSLPQELGPHRGVKKRWEVVGGRRIACAIQNDISLAASLSNVFASMLAERLGVAAPTGEFILESWVEILLLSI